MAARLGDVLWWLGLLLGAAVGLFILAASSGPRDDAVLFAALYGVVPASIGWVCRYILSGKKSLEGEKPGPWRSVHATEPAKRTLAERVSALEKAVDEAKAEAIAAKTSVLLEKAERIAEREQWKEALVEVCRRADEFFCAERASAGPWGSRNR